MRRNQAALEGVIISVAERVLAQFPRRGHVTSVTAGIPD